MPSSRYSAGVGATSITVRASGVSPGLVCTKRIAYAPGVSVPRLVSYTPGAVWVRATFSRSVRSGSVMLTALS